MIKSKAGRKIRSAIRARLKTIEVKKPKFEFGVKEPKVKHRNPETNTKVVQNKADPVCE